MPGTLACTPSHPGASVCGVRQFEGTKKVTGAMVGRCCSHLANPLRVALGPRGIVNQARGGRAFACRLLQGVWGHASGRDFNRAAKTCLDHECKERSPAHNGGKLESPVETWDVAQELLLTEHPRRKASSDYAGTHSDHVSSPVQHHNGYRY